MPLLQTAETLVEYLVTGRGQPVTLFSHGLAGAIEETRPFGSGVSGTRVFLHFRGHGCSSAPEGPWTYAALATELRAVADHVGASRALGVSLGAGALLRVVAEQPRRFERLVLVLPAVLDGPRHDAGERRLHRMADAVDACDVEGLADLLCQEQPEGVRGRPDVSVWARRRARRLVGSAAGRALREFAGQVPLDDRSVLASVRCPVLVIAQRGDDTHPVGVAEQTAAALPNAELAVFGPDGILWSHRRRLRELIGGFLDADDGGRG